MLPKSLTTAQREAVQHVDGPLLVLAGPGSGKTRVVTHRIAHLLEQEISARQIVALTFTNKAADEMRLRLARLVPDTAVWISTFHRFCARLLREYGSHVGLSDNFTIYDAGDSQKLLGQTIEQLQPGNTHTSVEKVARAIGGAKNELISPENYEARSRSPSHWMVREIYPAYQHRLLASNAVDFDDLLYYVAQLLHDNPELRATLDDRNRYILVDEYQDTNLAQYAILRALSSRQPNLAVTGDPDQSIYGWRGANLKNILEFESDFPNVNVVRLEQNFRSSKCIVRVADVVIAHNTFRKKKALFTENTEGAPVKLITQATQQEEADYIATTIAAAIEAGSRRPRDYGIFYRTNTLSRSLEQALYDHGLPYQIVNGLEFYQRKEIKDVLAYLFVLNNPCDDIALQRIINCPSRGIGKTTLGRLRDYATAHQLPLLEAARQCGLIESIRSKAAVSVARFVSMVDRLSEAVTAPVEEIIGLVLSESGYREYLKESDDLDDEERLANIEELMTDARQYDERNPGTVYLEEFLEQVALVNDTDRFELEADQITLMTLHSAKGLEFPVVFIVAVEENLLPHERSRDDPVQLEEERRLLFVGLTRAQEELHLSHVRVRDYRGRRRPSIPSMFLMELPLREMVVEDHTADFQHATPWPSAEPAPPRQRRGTARLESARLMTAADLVTGGSTPKQVDSSDSFFVGMIVSHPEYQLGKVVALSGSDERRTATVQFFGRSDQKKFHIATSPLQPVMSPEPNQ